MSESDSAPQEIKKQQLLFTRARFIIFMQADSIPGSGLAGEY